MASPDEKPLPEVPLRTSGQNLVDLTVEARTHLRRFISQALQDEGLMNDHGRWQNAFESALRELGASISRGRWLTGIRHMRVRMRKRGVETAKRTQEHAQKESEEESTSEKEKEKTSGSAQDKGKGEPISLAAESWRDRKLPRIEQHSYEGHSEDVLSAALDQLRELVSKASRPISRPSANHLLLTVDAHSALPTEYRGFDLLRSASAVDCTFVPNAFCLPDADFRPDDALGAVLYGLDEWDVNLYPTADEDGMQVVGGTFRFKGAVSLPEHACLCRVLRLAVFVYLSLVLEQHLLANSHVALHFRKPSIPPVASVPLVERPAEDGKRNMKRENALSVGLWSYLTKKTENLLHRATGVGPSFGRRGSLELPLTHSQSLEPVPSEHGSRQRPRHFSLISATSSNSPKDDDDASLDQHPISSALKRIEASKELLSTSPLLAVPLPSVLVSLAAKEKQDPSLRLAGDEKAALSSIMGWEGKATQGRGMTGMSGFVRQQGLSVLYSQHVPLPLVASQPPTSSSLTPPSSSAMLTSPRFAACGNRRKWVTYRYYDRRADESLGEMITRLCCAGEDPCDKPGCQFKRADHDLRWIHAGVRIVATVSLPSTSKDASAAADDVVQLWERCAVCGVESSKQKMLDGTYLLSFAKYLELFFYSRTLCALDPPLCEHTAVPPQPWSAPDVPLPQARLNIHRKFSCKARTVTFSLSTVEDIFELRMPRLQIMRRKVPEKNADKGDGSNSQTVLQSPAMEDGRRVLRREIVRWWQGLSEHIDKLEENFMGDDFTSHSKRLPRLPSADDAYDIFDEEGLETPKGHLSRLPSNSSKTPTDTSTVDESPHSSSKSTFIDDTAAPSDSRQSSDSTMSSGSSSYTHESNSIHLLSGLRHAFQRTEQNLYSELSRTPTASLNDVRRSFVTAARGASRRLSAWETKHSSQLPKGSALVGMPSMTEPEWWKSGCHAVPGGNVIVREGDWGSIIAFTLSSLDYHRELANMSNNGRPSLPPPPPTTPADVRPSFFSAGSSFKRLLPRSVPPPDPDQDGVVWQEPETYSAVISRKEHPREPTSLMPFREVLRHKAGTDSSDTPTSSKVNIAGPSNPRSPQAIPPAARAKPAVEVSMQAADGSVSGLPEAVEAVGKILHEFYDVEVNPSLADSWRSSSSNTPSSYSGFVETNIRRGKTASIMSADSDVTVEAESDASPDVIPPPPPPKDDPGTSATAPMPSSQAGMESHVAESHPFSLTESLTSTIANAMRYVLKPGDTQLPLPGTPHHGLLSADWPAIDERPHIKYDWTIGKRLKFSCTVYYAKQFDALRRRCGIQDVFLHSMARSENWAAEGGKSKSNFWKTSDGQFIIKTLVNAWNVADLQVLIELGPAYFRYMDATASKPSALAKLLGFYTVEIRNLESGTTQAKADLVVMENLFYHQKISKTFDLKGIQGRKVKASTSTSKTLFDGEWIEDQRRALILVRPHSKVVLSEAIRADCDFLARSNIMDYSLLLGIDEERKQIACGLVDTIGSYTFAKTLEYKAKQGLNAGKEVTVVPPNEYQERFVGAMDDYFLACPDKWSRPLDGTNVPSHYKDLPSVL
ncbi:hypothetical protein AcV7_005948 [Taiwanofungus camphoratus]|nr:hypothetical protein AcV7_005948 [Antrodia cinnamomea]